MASFVPDFILRRFKEKKHSGRFKAYTIFTDISGFTAMTQDLMSHGKEGVEILSNIINDIFSPSIEAIYVNGGFVSSFAGDAFTSIFKIKKAEYALKAAYRIHEIFAEHGCICTKFGDFQLAVKTGLSFGGIEFHIIDADVQKAYFFKGEGIDNSAKAEHHADKMQIISDKCFLDNLSVNISRIPIKNEYFLLSKQEMDLKAKRAKVYEPPSKVIERLFVPQAVVDLQEKGEFREIVACFISFSEESSYKNALKKVVENCHLYDGYFNRVDFGDKGGVVLVLFGAPISREKLYQRAADFMLRLRDIPDFRFRAGITCGTAFAGFVGSSIRREYTAFGDIVNLAARLMMKAEWMDILTDQEMAKSLYQYYTFQEKSAVRLKGFSKSVRPNYLISKKPRKQLISFSGSFIGRDEETGRLMRFAAPVFQNCFGGIIYIDGPAGIGKTRFIHNFGRLLKDCTIFYTVCDEILKRSFNPFVSFFKNYFQLDESSVIETRKLDFLKRYNELLEKTDDEELRKELIRTQSIIGALIGLEWRDSLYSQLDPKGRYDNTVFAVKNFIIAQSLQKPLIIIIDDGHWIDNDSVELLKVLTRNVNEFPFIIIIPCRLMDDGSKFTLFRTKEADMRVKRLELLPLQKKNMKALLHEKLESFRIPQDTENYIWEKSGGNPFFAEQLMLYLKENNILDDDFNLCNEVSDIPKEISQVIISRIDRLSSRMKNTIKTASILGRDFALNVLKRLLSAADITQTDKEFAKYLDIGCREKIWQDISELYYIFRHALIRDAVYEIQLKERVRRLHGLAGDIIEELYAESLDEHYEELADHYDKAGNTIKAVEYLAKSGDKAKESYKNEKALIFYERLMRYLEVGHDRKEIAGYLIKKGNIMQLTGRLDDAEKAFEKALEISRINKDRSLIAECMNNLGNVFRMKGRLREAKAIFEDSLRIAEAADDKKAFCAATNDMGNIHYELGDYEKAESYYRRLLSVCEKADDLNGVSRAMGNMGSVCSVKGNIDQALEYYSRSLALKEKLKDKYGMGKTLNNMGVLYWKTGDQKSAMECYKRQLAICQELGDKRGLCAAVGNMGHIYAEQSSFKKAMRNYKKYLEISIEMGNKKAISNGYCYLGLVYKALGNQAKSLEYYRNQQKICRETGDKSGYGMATGNIGNIYENQGRYIEADKCYRKYLEISQEMGDKRKICTAVSNLGVLYHNQGRLGEAMKHYDLALQMAREVKLKYQLCNCLYQKAELLYVLGRIQEAEALNEEALRTAEEINRSDMVINSNILKYKMENNMKALEAMLEKPGLDNVQKSMINYELWKITKDNRYSTAATAIFKKMLKKEDSCYYKKYIEEMKQS